MGETKQFTTLERDNYGKGQEIDREIDIGQRWGGYVTHSL